MKKIILLLFLCPALLFAWVGSRPVCRLVFPKSVYYEPSADWTLKDTPKEWQVYNVPAGVYGIVYNPWQGIDKHQIILQDMTTDETSLVIEVEGHNNETSGILTGGVLVKINQDLQIGKKYILILRAWDLNGLTVDDTAIIQPQRRQ